jgi:hypothetical protein
MQHDFTETLESGSWLVKISPSTEYGYFANTEEGEGGGLWFEGNELYDYDGVYELPKSMIAALLGAGYNLPWNFLGESDEEPCSKERESQSLCGND